MDITMGQSNTLLNPKDMGLPDSQSEGPEGPIDLSFKECVALATLPVTTLVAAGISALISSVGYDNTPFELLRYSPSIVYAITSFIYVLKSFQPDESFEKRILTAKLLGLGAAGTLAGALAPEINNTLQTLLRLF